MPKTSSPQKRVPPETFKQYNQTQYERVVQLTQAAIAKLEDKHQPVTLTEIAGTTRSLDSAGKGISTRTILRNSDAVALFRQHSPAYQARQQKTKKAKRKRVMVKGETRSTYRGLRSSDLIQIVEDLKQQNAELKAQLDRYRADREAAYQVRDEALQHNARLVASLTIQATLPHKEQ